MTSFTIQVIINNRASTSDSLHGTRLTTLVRLIRTFYDVNTHAVANFYNYFGDVMPSSNPRFTTGSDPILTGFSAPFRLRSNFPFPRFGSRKASGASGSISLIFDVIRCRLPPPSVYTNAFDDDYIRIFNGKYDPTCWMTFKHIYSILYQLGSNTGASFQATRNLLSAAFPPTQLYYFLRLSVFVNEPFRSKAQKLLAQVLRKRQLQSPTTLTQLLLPPLHVRNCPELESSTWHITKLDCFSS